MTKRNTGSQESHQIPPDLTGGGASSPQNGADRKNISTSSQDDDAHDTDPPRSDPQSMRMRSVVVTHTDDGEEHYLTAEDFVSDRWIGQIYTDPKRLSIEEKAYCFHNVNAKGAATGVVDQRIFNYITHTQRIFVLGGIPYVYDNGYYAMDLRGTRIKSLIFDCCLEQFARSSTTSRIFNTFLQKHELEKELPDLNKHSGHYINFKNGMYDVVRKKLYPHEPKLFSINQIPWEYDPNADHGDGSEIENFLAYSVPDPDDREMLLEYIGLCCSIDRDQQKMMVICGDGGTGKSTMINLIQTIVGERNISNVAMSRLSDNFQAISMMGKLLNACADLEIDALDDVTTIKKLIGEDKISDSYKGKDIISFDNYAKLLFSTNELPLVRNEKTEGFYRRLLVLTMNQKPTKRDANLPKRLKAQLPYLIHLAMEALNRMYERGYILESDNSRASVKQLRNDSDTIEAFLNENYVRTNNNADRVDRTSLYKEYKEYCDNEERTAHTRNNFYKALRNKGLGEATVHGTRYVSGLRDKSVGSDGFMIPPPDDELPFDV